MCYGYESIEYELMFRDLSAGLTIFWKSMSSISCKTKSARLRQFLRKRCCPIPNCLDTPQPSTTSNLSQEIFAFADPVIYIYMIIIYVFMRLTLYISIHIYTSPIWLLLSLPLGRKFLSSPLSKAFLVAQRNRQKAPQTASNRFGLTAPTALQP